MKQILKSINPYTNSVIEEFEEFSDSKLENKLTMSGDAFEKWKLTSFKQRKLLMTKVSGLLIKNKKLYAGAISCEMGKPVNEALAEVEKCAWVCEYYALNTETFLHREIIETDADASYVYYEPLGTILGIMPWNFPFWQVFRFAVPTLMAGNTVLLKHASNVQVCARHIENIFIEAGFPSSVFLNLVIGSGKVGKIIGHQTIKAISLTGSELAGKQVAENAGRKIKKTVLELGGSNAFVVLEDADIEQAVAVGIRARMQNAGQSCIAAKRFIVDKKVSDRFIALFKEEIGKLSVGDPMDESTDLGPLANIHQAESVEMQVNKSVEMGAKVIVGGERLNAFYLPSLLINVRPGMPLFDEEVFGPVAPVITASSTDEAVVLANKTKFGLGVTLFTNDLKLAENLVHKFNDGAVFINSMVKSDPRLPFGGTKQSGYGRELSAHGIREFVNVKTVYLKRP
jgi:succinate-semialdehyde dehydrogenase/glutarate-semialdehyde dehydrogenase